MTELLEGYGRAVSGEVIYADEPIATHALNFDLNDVANRGIELVLEELLREHTDELFFKKLRDWETEYEYRFVVDTRSADPINVDIGSWLEGVVLGPLVSNSYLPAIRELCEPRGIRVSRLSWLNGRPSALPLPDPPN